MGYNHKVNTALDLARLTSQEQKTLREFLSRLRRQFNGQIPSVILFGSRARGDAQPDSDVDVAVIAEQGDIETCHAIRDLAFDVLLENGLHISTRVWSPAHWRHLEELQTGLYKNIQREGIELLASALDELPATPPPPATLSSPTA